MNSRRVKPVVIDIIYGIVMILFLISVYFVSTYGRRMLFDSSNTNTNYVDGEITEGYNNDIPVVNTSVKIVRPYLDNSVVIAKTFYDYKAENDKQEEAIIYYENTYMQNSGVDYSCDNVFDVISILDGTVISVNDNDVLGTTVEIRHSNDLISSYQSLSDVVVKKDDKVIQGQIIAKSGSSNLNKEIKNHLHFEIYNAGMIVNPEEYYNKSVDEL